MRERLPFSNRFERFERFERFDASVTVYSKAPSRYRCYWIILTSANALFRYEGAIPIRWNGSLLRNS